MSNALFHFWLTVFVFNEENLGTETLFGPFINDTISCRCVLQWGLQGKAEDVGFTIHEIQ